jgi:glycosyltransferase involved in cell wall biosynthesis
LVVRDEAIPPVRAVKPVIYQLNLSRGLGGAEMSTHAFSRALDRAGWPSELLVHRDARFWNDFDFGAVRVKAVDAAAVPAHVPHGAMLVIHGSTPEAVLQKLATSTHIIGLAHHALSEHNRFRYCELAHWLLPVSRHVMDTLDREGLRHYDTRPLYGVADIARGDPAAPIIAHSPYEWDARKGRDRVLARVQPALARLRTSATFARRSGLSLAIVSRISDAKQFPALFRAIAPALAERSDVAIDIFGTGLYQKVRALERSLSPIRRQVRFWGWQSNIAAVFANIDFLLTGLPEREAMGLNVIEAQACGVPVLGVDARPFRETILDGRTGYLYRDPREDAGASFATLLDRLRAAPTRLDPRAETQHLAQFSATAFTERVDAAMHRAVAEFGLATETSRA